MKLMGMTSSYSARPTAYLLTPDHSAARDEIENSSSTGICHNLSP